MLLSHIISIVFSDEIADFINETGYPYKLFFKVLKKWAAENPHFAALDPQKQEEVGYKIFQRHTAIKNSINVENPAVEAFLTRYDGEYDSPKYELRDLLDIQRLPIDKLVEFILLLYNFCL